MRLYRLLAATLAVTFCSCSSSHPASTADVLDASDVVGSAGRDATAADAADAARPDKSAACASTFGQAIGTLGFARFDGTVVAVVPPGDPACAEENSTHLVVQIRTGADVYRMVIDVSDTSAPGTIHRHTISSHALIGDAWSPGWHTGLKVDYAQDLGVHTADFDDETTDVAVPSITDAIAIGAPISIYATAQGEADSAHLVHRHGLHDDGAIVLGPDGPSPTWLLFAFADSPAF